MLRNLDWQATDDLARAQLDLFLVLGEEAGLTDDEKGRALDLDYQVWSAWTGFLADGPLPAKPPLPDMLLRLGESAFSLSDPARKCAV
jgi:hypothetical protein